MKKSDVNDTGFPGIKQRISDGKYIVILDLGRQWKKDKKTGEQVLKQVKTQKVVNTLTEAKALRGENDTTKRFKKVSGLTGKIPFETAMDEYLSFMNATWGISHRERQQTHAKRAKDYFHGKDVREIETLDIENFFRWCRKNNDYPVISNNTIMKLKSQLNGMFKWLMKAPKRYGVKSNPVENAYVGEEESFEAVVLSVQMLNEIFDYMLKNETDTSNMVMFGLAVLCGLRRGEICGLQWGDIFWEEKKLYIVRQRAEVDNEQGWTVLTPKEGREDGKTSNERRERWTALPDHMAEILKIAKLQQEAYGGEVRPDDYVYRTKVNLVDNYLAVPNTLYKRLNSIRNRCNKVRKKAGMEEIPKFRLHDLRHTHVSMCLNNGVNPFVVSASVGHKLSGNEYNTTIRVYWHDDGNREEINECVDKLITVPIIVPDMEERLLIPKQRTSERINKRSDEI